jgi:hypothetical protein
VALVPQKESFDTFESELVAQRIQRQQQPNKHRRKKEVGKFKIHTKQCFGPLDPDSASGMLIGIQFLEERCRRQNLLHFYIFIIQYLLFNI